MKESILIILIIILAQTHISAQVVTAVAPLKPGNKWIYYSKILFQRDIKKYEVTDTMKIINDIQFFLIFNTPYNDVTYMTLLNNEFYARYDESMPDSLYKYFKINPKIGDEWEQNLALEGATLYSTIIDTFSAQVFNISTLIFVVDRTDSGVVGSREYWTEEFGMLNGLYEQAEDILKGCVIEGVVYGDTTTVGISDEEKLPTEFVLHQNYPNPFNSSTTISFKLKSSESISLIIYDVMGNEIKRVIDNEWFNYGSHKIVWDGNNNSNQPVLSGVYYYRLINGSVKVTHSMILIK
ncbi:MAG: hypothetical protein A2315_13210 [Ignavibacteria bacterium RIFOXYB2_FULL_35_12]|nr:MAG: hypothetical protein A2058_05840 [Ignavibacteria bacterium GWA2_36_19]OGU55581.1 MAG: hypothetical protein A2006_06115 [Ignavibacteria bacterium GWC2_35_8]OGU61858.1 MAG: hypothetical protein A2X60_07750 [Ignavibacteria bacterium GWF2_35_20]OGU88230.1 MAG: hypothetical protein A3K31_09870 [Ignavibacteria bacterium RIFOXYA12_FULL_35_25]OGU91282.1 MAG: hypothetical protein A2492_03860 [Ignavibacteria bacterium RIFOXYC12_FULL_35_11]OGU93224.1 MAG: hypothetical protein A2347_08375 [Ignavib